MDMCAAGEQSVQQEESVVLMNKINERICALDKILDSQQKCSLKNELSAFLASLLSPKDLCTALPGDLRKFLVFKEIGKIRAIFRDISRSGDWNPLRIQRRHT